MKRIPETAQSSGCSVTLGRFHHGVEQEMKSWIAFLSVKWVEHVLRAPAGKRRLIVE